MSRAEQNLARKFEAQDRRRLAAAAEQIAANADLRFFVRALLSLTNCIDNSGMGGNPFTSNALTTAHETGKMAAMQHLVALLADANPSIYPELIKEHLNEQRDRAAALAAAIDTADRG